MIDFRAGILAITICLLINAAANYTQPPPLKPVDYCLIAERGQFMPCAGLKYTRNI